MGDLTARRGANRRPKMARSVEVPARWTAKGTMRQSRILREDLGLNLLELEQPIPEQMAFGGLKEDRLVPWCASIANPVDRISKSCHTNSPGLIASCD
jgi:hypothetical protein